MDSKSGIVLYRAKDGKSELDVRLDKDNVWLTQRQMGALFKKDTDTIGLHLRNIYDDEELEENSTTEKYSVVQIEGNRRITREIVMYNLDVIITVGYRVRSKEGIRFRKWARDIVKSHLINGFSVNNDRLRELQATFENQKETYMQLRFFLNKFLDRVARKDVVDTLIEKVDGLSQNIEQIQKLIKRLEKRK
jgi:hypothetical protein